MTSSNDRSRKSATEQISILQIRLIEEIFGETPTPTDIRALALLAYRDADPMNTIRRIAGLEDEGAVDPILWRLRSPARKLLQRLTP